MRHLPATMSRVLCVWIALVTVASRNARSERPAPRVGPDSCANLGNTRLVSPDSTHELVLFVRRCPERTTGEIAIVARGAGLPAAPGNVPVPGHSMRVAARWLSKDSVIVAVPRPLPLRAPARVGGVIVRYEHEAR
jgi:hypothetical protein